MHVARFQMQVVDARLVRGRQCFGDLPAQGGGLLGVKRSVGKDGAQVAPGHPLTHDVTDAVALVDVENLEEPRVGDVRSVARGCGQHVGGRIVARHGLNEYRAAQDLVDGAPRAHGADLVE